MATEPEPTDDEADNIKAFTELLEKIGPGWLDKLRPSSPSLPPADKKTEGSLTDFLQSALDKSEKAREKMAEQLEALRDLLTPEQLTLFKSLKSAAPADQNSPKPNDKPNDKPVDKAPPKRKWL